MLNKPFVYITNPDYVYHVYEECKKVKSIAVDVETTRRRDLPPTLKWNENIHKPGLDPYLSEIRLLQIATPKVIYVIDCFYCPDVSILGEIFASEDILKIGHNLKFDVKMMMRQWGFKFRRLFDTMLASQVIANGRSATIPRHRLQDVAMLYLKIELSKDEQKSDWGAEELSMKQLEYAAKDVDVLHDIARVQVERAVNKQTQLNLIPTFRLEFDCLIAVARMELDGVYVDPDIWNSIDADITARFLVIQEDLKKMLGVPNINLDSPVQVLKALRNLGIDIESTNSKYLEGLHLDHPVMPVLLEYRGLAKLLTSYGNGIPGKKRKKNQIYFIERIHPITGRIHPDGFGQCLTETGRFNCERPNVQNVPNTDTSNHRKAFIGQTFYGVRNDFIVADYSQFEMRILAELSGDPNLLKAFTLGDCIHTATASLMFGVPLESIQYKDSATGKKVKGPNYWMRGAAKSINFGLAYGRGARSLAGQIGVTPEEAKELLKQYFRTYSVLKAWLDNTAHAAVRNQFSKTPLGRIRYYMGDFRDHMYRAGVEREGKNTPIQGCNADVTKRALFRVHCATEHLMGEVFIVNVIHDEINAEAPPDISAEICELIKNEMEAAGREFLHRVPVIAEAAYGEDWTIK